MAHGSRKCFEAPTCLKSGKNVSHCLWWSYGGNGSKVSLASSFKVTVDKSMLMVFSIGATACKNPDILLGGDFRYSQAYIQSKLLTYLTSWGSGFSLSLFS